MQFSSLFRMTIHPHTKYSNMIRNANNNSKSNLNCIYQIFHTFYVSKLRIYDLNFMNSLVNFLIYIQGIKKKLVNLRKSVINPLDLFIYVKCRDESQYVHVQPPWRDLFFKFDLFLSELLIYATYFIYLLFKIYQ